jgi:hypothetical protein
MNFIENFAQDELARVFVTLFDAKHLLAPLLWNMFYKEVEVSDCMQTLFRGNSLASKVSLINMSKETTLINLVFSFELDYGILFQNLWRFVSS